MDFKESNINGLIVTSALTNVIAELNLHQILLLAPRTILNGSQPPEFQIMVATGQLEASFATVELHFEVAENFFGEKFLITTNITSPLNGLLFLQRNTTRFDMRQRFPNFPFFAMQLKNADRTYSNVIELM